MADITRTSLHVRYVPKRTLQPTPCGPILRHDIVSTAMMIDTRTDMHRIFSSIYWHPTLLRALVAIIFLAGAVWLVMTYFNPAPPSTITIATGPEGGAYEFFAEQYRQRLARANVTLNVRITGGTAENIRLLEEPKSGV
jgi:hypothetical protein